MSALPLGQRYDQWLRDELRRLPRRRFIGSVWRACDRRHVDPVHWNPKFGRWNVFGQKLANTAKDKETAKREIQYHHTEGGALSEPNQCDVVYELRAELENVLNLSSWKILNRFGIDQTTFGTAKYGQHHSEYGPSQRISAAVDALRSQKEELIDAIIVPSARSSGQNLIVFKPYRGPDPIWKIGKGEDFSWG